MRAYFFNAEPTNDVLHHPTGYDREYGADEATALITQFFQEEAGVFVGDKSSDACKVVLQEDGKLRVCAGTVIVRGRVCEFDGTETISVSSSRKIVARMDKSAEVRDFQLRAVQEPVISADTYDFVLAEVTVDEDGVITAVEDKRTFLAMKGQPPYYPPDTDALPYMLWLYVLGFPMTPEQKAAVEGNPSLMSIYQHSVGGAYRRFYKRFEPEDWTNTGNGYEIAVPYEVHHLNASDPICVHQLHMLVGRTVEDYKAATLAEGQAKFIQALQAANTANQATPGTYPTAADGHIILTWYQIQYYLLSGQLIAADLAQSQAASMGYNWKDISTKTPTGEVNSLDVLLSAGYTPMLGGSAANFNALCTLNTLWGLNLRRKADTTETGAAHTYDMYGKMVSNTWGCLETDISLGADKVLRLVSETPYAGEILTVG